MKVLWRVGPGVRCNLFAYAAKNMSGKRQVVQLFPQGARKGTIDGSAFGSLVIRAVLGTRIILAASQSDSWELAAWRCVRMVEGHSLRSEQKHGLPGVRIPDLEMYDSHGAKRTDSELQSTYPNVDSLAEGEGWTFGRTGKLAGRVAMIIVEREDIDGVVLSPPERVASAILEEVQAHHPEALPGALDAACRQLKRELEGPLVDESLDRIRARFT